MPQPERKDPKVLMRKTWSDFVRHMRCTPFSIWKVPDDYLVQEWHLFMTYARNKVYY